MKKPLVIVVAGGLATRMGQVTDDVPKCLINVNGKPLMQHQIEFFEDRGYKDFIFCVSHLSDRIKNCLKDGSSFGVNIRYSEEPNELMGTAGAVKLAEDMVDNTCIIYYGDNLTTVDFDDALRFHDSAGSDFTLIVRQLPDGATSGSLITMDDSNRIDVFIEKPPAKEFKKYKITKYINCGMYIMNKEVFALIPKDMKYDFAYDLIPDMLDRKCNVYGYATDEFFRELGRVEKYDRFLKEVSKKDRVLK